MINSESPLNTNDYKDAGVDINAAAELIQRIKPLAARTNIPGIISPLGGFASLLEFPSGYDNPVLVSGMDGVGTKLLLAKKINDYSTIGIDLVAMCVNDIVTQGAEPLFFQDYIAMGKLDVDIAEQIIVGICRGCEMAGCALTGGETAEMPGLYSNGDFDLVGSCTGIVEKSKIIDGSKVECDNVVLGLASSGLHSNGYSLVRKIFEKSKTLKYDDVMGPILLEPTRIYVQSILSLIEKINVHAIAHITGGGLLDNIPRVIPNHHSAKLNMNAWEMPQIFKILAEHKKLFDETLFRTFNCGIGMIVIIHPDDVKEATELLTSVGETVYNIGTIINTPGINEVIYTYDNTK
jgi:phosphoribosylformylglycinamidine cyclo-ligase